MVVLPRQAPDKHRETLEKEGGFSQGYGSDHDDEEEEEEEEEEEGLLGLTLDDTVTIKGFDQALIFAFRGPKNASFGRQFHTHTKHDHFAKTGWGQTWEKR
jgi:hypothetical protein